jgi:hypothetical protein
MKTTLLALTLTALSLIWSPAAASAQASSGGRGDRIARGTVTEIGGASLTVKVGSELMTFGADSKTAVQSRGAGTKARQMEAAGKPGPHLSDVLKVGQSVAVTYHDMAGKPYASAIRTIPAAGTGSGSVTTAAAMRSRGTVKAIGRDSITIVGGAGNGASFTQTFVVTADTTIIGKGVGTAVASTGGKAPVTDLIAAGDTVSVSYRKAGGALQATDVRLVTKGLGSH